MAPHPKSLLPERTRLLQNNAIYGPIPAAIGKLEKLQTLDLSNNNFNGEMPSSLGDLKNLNYLRLNNNSLIGAIPESLSEVEGLTLVELSFNNLGGSLTKISTRTFNSPASKVTAKIGGNVDGMVGFCNICILWFSRISYIHSFGIWMRSSAPK